MVALTPRGDLSIAEIAFFAPALVISIPIIVRHGFARQIGWVYLALLSVLRLIGASCLLYVDTQHPSNPTSLLECAAITSAVGTAPLLLALLGFLERINEGMILSGRGISKIGFQVIHLVSILALILAIVGGVKESSTSVSDMNTGRELMEAAAIIFLLMYIALAAITLLFLTRKSDVLNSERKLLYAGVVVLPFLLVRIIYTVVVSFSHPGSTFYFREPNVLAESFMQFLMEGIIVTIFIIAGILTPKQIRQQNLDAAGTSSNKPVEIISGPDPARARAYEMEMESGRNQHHSAPSSQQPQRNLGDYRPSKMLRNALSGR